MHVSDWILTPFDLETQNADVDSQLQKQKLTNMTVDLKVKFIVEKQKA